MIKNIARCIILLITHTADKMTDGCELEKKNKINSFVFQEADQSSTSPIVKLSDGEYDTIKNMFSKSPNMLKSARIFLKKRWILSFLFQLTHGLYLSEKITDVEHQLMYSFCISLFKALESEFILKCPTMTPTSSRTLYSNLMADQIEEIQKTDFKLCSKDIYYLTLNHFFGTDKYQIYNPLHC